MMRQRMTGGNWKMHTTLPEALALAGDVRHRLGSQRLGDVVIFPPFPFLQPVAEKMAGSQVTVGAQDLHFEPKGAFTGAVSAAMLASVGCTHVLCGHSERRAIFGDSNAIVGKKLTAAIAAGLKPVLCVGEQLAERQNGTTFAIVDAQLEAGLAGQTAQTLQNLVIAYEPVWAIGTGLTASPEQAQEVHAHIRGWLGAKLGKDFAQQCRIQYGGSVKGANAAGLFAMPDIDGMLVGGASLTADEFAAIVRAGRATP